MTNLNDTDFLATYVSLPNNLFALLAKYHVIVPGIQRHYVQGSDHPHAKEVRERLIGDILTGCRKSEPVCLDFIYGPVETVGADAVIPVDGQQRLTTIWLLARYFAEFADDVTREQTLQLLSRFSYEDRTHATRFCREITMHENRFEGGNPISDTIRKAPWFNPFWAKDSTVAAMLNTMGTIHELCQNVGAGKIEAKDMLHYIGTQLTFCLCVNAFGQDIYMKMNARGLTLTQWENFKGRFAEKVKEPSVQWNERIEVLSNAYYARSQNLPDNAFFALMARILVYEARDIKIDGSAPVNIFKLAKHTDTDWTKELPHVPFKEFKLLLDKLQASSVKVAKSFLDLIAFVSGSEGVANIFTPYWQAERSMIQCLFCPKSKNELDFSLCLYEYFKAFPTPNSEDFNLALRLIWNILENVSIGDNENQYNRVTGVTQIIQKGCQSLYPEQMPNDNKSSLQYAEEAEKATVYSKGQKEDIALMKDVEVLMHGRIRLGVLDLNNNNLPSFRRERMAKMQKLFELYAVPANQKKIILMVVAAEPVALQDVIALSDDKENLRKLLTTHDDKYLQTSLLDFLAGRLDIMQTDCRDILDKNKSKFIQKQWWERDWRKTIVQIGIGENGYEVFTHELWNRYVKWHRNSGRLYLYEGNSAIIRNALPINDYRIELCCQSMRKIIEN